MADDNEKSEPVDLQSDARQRGAKGSSGSKRPPRSVQARGTGGGFFEVYKRGQGYWTRVGTAVGGGLIILAGAAYVDDRLSIFRTDDVWTLYLQHGVPVLMIVGLGLLLYWLVGANRKCCDFMIATEGEMKKVSWSTKRELIVSTKVVIVATLSMGFMLFVVDLIFMLFFSSIGVLRGQESIWKALFGIRGQ